MIQHDIARAAIRTLREHAPRLRGVERLKRSIARLLALQGPFVTTSYGALFEIDLRDHVEANIFWESYETGALTFWQPQIGPGSVFFDVGANVGIFTILAAIRGARVVAFEPNPRTRQRLLANVARNGLNSRVSVRAEALFDGAEQKATLYDDVNVGASQRNSGLPSLSRKNSIGAGIEVDLTTLDAVAEQLSLDRLDWIKLDIQGAELGALRGAARTIARFRPRIILELDHKAAQNMGWTEADLRAFLDGLGYTLRVLDGIDMLAEPIAKAAPVSPSGRP